MFAPAFGLVIAMAVLTAEAEQVATEIDGDWKLVSCSIDGHEEIDEKAAKEEAAKEEMEVFRLEKGDCRIVKKSKLGKPTDLEAKESEDTEDDSKVEYRLNPTTDPKQIDWIIRDADEKKIRTFQGIYRLKDEELVVCFTVTEGDVVIDCLFGGDGPQYDMAESPRPTKFEPTLQEIWTLKRVAAEKNSP